MKHYNLFTIVLIPALILFSSFNFQEDGNKIDGLYKLVQINDNNLPTYSERDSKRITLSGVVLFSQDGMWATLFNEKESEDTPDSFGMLKGKFENKNNTVVLYDEILDDTYFGELKRNDFLIVTDEDKNTYMFKKVDMKKL